MQKKDEKKLINGPSGQKKKQKKTAVSADLSGDLLHEENPECLDILLHLWADQEFGSQRQTCPPPPTPPGEILIINTPMKQAMEATFLKEKIQNQQTNKYSALKFVSSGSF